MSLSQARSPRPNTPNTAKSVTLLTDEAVGLQVQQFLDDWHYRIMNSLGSKWTQSQAITAALEILTLNGLNMTPSDIKSCSHMEEPLIVREVVSKLPQVLREDFDHLGLQLQMLVTTTCRVRKCVDDGMAESIQDTIEEVDSTSIGQQILKQVVVQASKEVASLHKCQDTWFVSMEKRLDRLTRSAELAEHAQQQLVAVETQLAQFGEEQNAKSKKALVGLADSNDKSLLHTMFSTWLGLTLANQSERNIRRKYQKEIEDLEKALYDYKEAKLKNVKSVLHRSAMQQQGYLLANCMQAWSAEVADAKRSVLSKEQMEALESKIEGFTTSQSENTKKVMARMGGDQDAALVGLAMSAWLKFSQDYKKDKEFEEQVKRSERTLQEHMKKKKDEAKAVLDRMNGATGTGLMQQCLLGWHQCIAEDKKSKELEEKMATGNSRFKSMKLRQKGNVMSVQGRVNEQIKANLMLRCFNAWMLESKVNHVDKYYTNKMNHKRQQLQSVQTLFKSFAKQLEEGLGNLDGDSSGRTNTRRSKSGMVKDYGSVSLPDIHARPMPA